VLTPNPKEPIGSPKPVDPRKVIDADHRGLCVIGWFMTLEGILLTLAAVVAYIYKHFH
jgi:hypothetical protein